jgi:hypothetical protein
LLTIGEVLKVPLNTNVKSGVYLRGGDSRGRGEGLWTYSRNSFMLVAYKKSISIDGEVTTLNGVMHCFLPL